MIWNTINDGTQWGTGPNRHLQTLLAATSNLSAGSAIVTAVVSAGDPKAGALPRPLRSSCCPLPGPDARLRWSTSGIYN